MTGRRLTDPVPFKKGDSVKLTARYAETLNTAVQAKRVDWCTRRGIVRSCNATQVTIMWPQIARLRPGQRRRAGCRRTKRGGEMTIEIRCSRDLAIRLGAVTPETTKHHREMRDAGHMLIRDGLTGEAVFWPFNLAEYPTTEKSS
jgi:hypothetical protein